MNDPKSRTRAKRVAHTKGMARVFAFFTVLGIVSAFSSIRFARAEVLDQSLVIGRQMTEVAKSSKNETAQIVLNGQTIMFANQLSKESPGEVLARYEQLCRDEAAQHDDQTTVLRADTKQRDEGSVMCFVKSGTSKASLKEALETFARTGEMGALGQMRYAYAKKTAQGNTSVLAAWTLEKFNFHEMLPENDDAPGQDFAELPRPHGSRRIFSVRLAGEPYGVNVYESSNETPTEIALAYDRTLTGQGWFAIDIEGERKRAEPRLAGVTGRLYEKDGVFMTVATHVENGKTITALGVALR